MTDINEEELAKYLPNVTVKDMIIAHYANKFRQIELAHAFALMHTEYERYKERVEGPHYIVKNNGPNRAERRRKKRAK